MQQVNDQTRVTGVRMAAALSPSGRTAAAAASLMATYGLPNTVYDESSWTTAKDRLVLVHAHGVSRAAFLFELG
jgi:hypothetical protein